MPFGDTFSIGDRGHVAEHNRVGARLNLLPTAREFGAVGDGVADDTDALQRAIDVGGRIVLPPGRYVIRDTLAVWADDTVIESHGAVLFSGVSHGACLSFAASPGQKRWRCGIDGTLTIRQSTRDWDMPTVGLDLQNCNEFKADDLAVRDFQTGIRIYGAGTGASYNELGIRYCGLNRVGLLLDSDETGWVAENNVRGGSWTTSYTDNLGQSAHVRVTKGGPLRLWGCSFEGNMERAVLLERGAGRIQFYGCRIEMNYGHALAGIDSSGLWVSMFGCGFGGGSFAAIANGRDKPELLVRSGAGPHFLFDSPCYRRDENSPTVICGIGNARNLTYGWQAPAISTATNNLVFNGSFRYWRDDVPADWRIYAAGGTKTTSMVPGDGREGAFCLHVENVGPVPDENVRVYQYIECVPGVPHTLRAWVRCSNLSNSTFGCQVGVSLGGGSTAYMNVLLAHDGEWHLLETAFTPLATPACVTFRWSGAEAFTADIDGVAVLQGCGTAMASIPAAITESGLVGDDGNRYRLRVDEAGALYAERT